MKAKTIFIMFLTAFQMLSCQKENSTEPADENIYPQQSISWPSLADSPWPMHHHDPQSTGRSSLLGAQSGNIAWKYDLKAPIGTSIAIGPDSTIYFASSYDTSEGAQAPFLYAFNWSGELKWKLKLQKTSMAVASQSCSPLIASDGTIYIGARDHHIYAINPNGTLKWTYEAGDEIYSISLTVDKVGNLYFIAADNALYSITPDGALNWKTTNNYKFLCSPLAGISFSPDGSTLYLATAEDDTSSGLAAVDLSGNVKWIFKTGLAECTPLVDNAGNIFFGAGMGLGTSDEGKTGIFSLDSSGKLRWQYLADYVNNKDVTMDYDGNVYFSVDLSGTKTLLVSLTNEGEKRWELDISSIGPLTSSLICDQDGTIYGSAWLSTIYAVSKNGELKWQSSIGQINGNSPAIAHGKIITGTWYHNPGKELVCIN